MSVEFLQTITSCWVIAFLIIFF